MECPGCHYDETKEKRLFYIFLDIDGVLNNMEYWKILCNFLYLADGIS